MRKYDRKLVDEYVRRLAKIPDITPGDERTAKIAAIAALELEHFDRMTKPANAVSCFDRILSIDENRRYFAQSMSEAVGEADLVGRWGKRLDDHIMQDDDPRLSADMTKFGLKMLAPQVTARTANLNVSASMADPPSDYDYSPPMVGPSGLVGADGASRLESSEDAEGE